MSSFTFLGLIASVSNITRMKAAMLSVGNRVSADIVMLKI